MTQPVGGGARVRARPRSVSPPRSTSRVTAGRTLVWRYWAHSGLGQTWEWFSFMPVTLWARRGRLQGRTLPTDVAERTSPRCRSARCRWRPARAFTGTRTPRASAGLDRRRRARGVSAAGTWVLPPTRALWIPAGTEHETGAVGATVLRGALRGAGRGPITWPAPQPLAVATLLAELLLYLGGEGSKRGRANAGRGALADLLDPSTWSRSSCAST